MTFAGIGRWNAPPTSTSDAILRLWLIAYLVALQCTFSSNYANPAGLWQLRPRIEVDINRQANLSTTTVGVLDLDFRAHTHPLNRSSPIGLSARLLRPQAMTSSSIHKLSTTPDCSCSFKDPCWFFVKLYALIVLLNTPIVATYDNSDDAYIV